jgi:coproporphyrinogen III oxidase-like Fe-S oxidoreductase
MHAVIFNKSPEVASDIIEEKDAKFEFIMLGLRTTAGISIQKYNSTFNADFDTEYAEVLQKKGKYLLRNGDNLKIKDEYLYVQNDIIMDFLQE